MKKFLALLLAVVMVLSLAACGSEAPAPAPTEAPAEQPAETPAEQPADAVVRAVYCQKLAHQITSAAQRGRSAPENRAGRYSGPNGGRWPPCPR